MECVPRFGEEEFDAPSRSRYPGHVKDGQESAVLGSRFDRP